MPFDKIVDSDQLDSKLRELANAIRTKGGTTAPLDFLSGGFTDAVDAIKTGSPVTPYKSIEVRTWVGDGTSVCDIGINPGTNPIHIFMAANYDFGVNGPADDAAQFVAVRNDSYLSNGFGGVAKNSSNGRDASRGAAFENGKIELLATWGNQRIKFQSGITYIVVIGKL